jgi:hypothetical protein
MAISISQLKQPLGLMICLSTLVVSLINIQQGKLNMLKADNRSLSLETLQRETKIKSSSLAVWKQMPAFGFKNLIADFAFLSAVGSMYIAQPEKSIALMNQGFQKITPQAPQNSYYLWRMKGVDELLFLNNSQAAQQSLQKSADWARIVGDEEGLRVAAISQKTADTLAKNPNSKEAQFGGWSLVLSNAVDLKAKRIAVRKLRELGGKVYLDENGQIKIDKPPKK